jgi:hypothetical protein
MLAIYKVILEPEGKEKLFRVTWHNLENNSQYCSIRESEITPEEIHLKKSNGFGKYHCINWKLVKSFSVSWMVTLTTFSRP